nr:hypothetical protein [Tanacetum cinerariifolium]
MQKYTRFDAQSFKDAMICNMDSIGKYMLEIFLHQQRTLRLLKQKKLMQTQEDHSDPISAFNVDSLKVDLVVIQNTCSEKEDGTRIEYGFKREFMSLFGQDADTFTSTMLFNKSIAKRTRHQRQYDRRMNKRHMQTQKSKIDMGKPVDVDLVVTKSNGTEPEVQDDSSRSGNYMDADDADIRPIYDEDPMAEMYVFNAKHDACITRLLKEVNSRTKIQSHKTRNSNKPVDQKSHRFSPNMTSVVYEKTSPRSDLRWKPTGRIFKSVGLGGFLQESYSTLAQARMTMYVFNAKHDACITRLLKEVNSRTKIQSHKTRNSNKPVDQKSHRFSLNMTSVVYEKTSLRSDLRWKPTGRIFKSVGLRWIPTGKLFNSCTSKDDKVPTADMISMTTMIELKSLFGPSFDEYFNGENQVVSKPSAVTTADTSDKRQQ